MYLIIIVALVANVKPKVGEATEDEDDTVDSSSEDIGFGTADDTINYTVKNTDGTGADEGFPEGKVVALGADGMNEVFGTV